MKCLLFFIPLILLVGCIEKGNNDADKVWEKWTQTDPEEYKGDSIFNMVDFIFSSQDGEKANVLDNCYDIQYFAIDSAELRALKMTLRRYLEKDKGNAYHPFAKYFRQYIGFEYEGNRYVYVNLFTHYQCKGKSHPTIDKEIYTEKNGRYDFGHVIIDMDINDVIECSFINTVKE